MIRPDITYVKNLVEFNQEIKNIQKGAHTEAFIAQHNAIEKYAKECKIIKELGVCQGATLSTMMLCHPEKLIGIDIDDKHFTPYQKHFYDYAKKNNIDFKFIKGSSVDRSFVSEVDMLHIDSLHTPKHLIKELRLHAPKVRKYIIFHDTANFKATKGLFKTIAGYITEEEQEWKVVDHYIQRVGYTVLKREKRIL